MLALISFCSFSFGKAAFYDFPHMIEMSDVIAITDVTDVSATVVKYGGMTYSEKVSARVLEVLKGDPGKTITIYGNEDFPCAQCRFLKGRQLVFLKQNGGIFFGANWQLGIRPISSDQIKWFINNSSIEMASIPLHTALQQVRTEIEKQKIR